MKKIATTLLTLILALCCMFSLAACGEDKDGDDSTGDNPAPDVKMSETAWNACVAEFEALTNYTETWYNSNRGLISRTIKLDGTTYYEDKLEYETDIYEKTGDAYFNYHKSYSPLTSTWTNWTKSSITQEDYEEALLYNTTRLDVVGVLNDNYADFAYSEGKYTLDEYDLDGIEVSDIVVSVTGGKIVKITFTAEYLGDVKFENFGTTEINVPTDDTQSGGEISVAGKSFVFYDMTCDAYDDATLAQVKAGNEGMTIVFGANGDVTITQLMGTIVQTGTYSIEDGNIEITVTSMTMGGEEINVGDGVTVNCTFDGEELIMASLIDAEEGIYAYSTFIEQA